MPFPFLSRSACCPRGGSYFDSSKINNKNEINFCLLPLSLSDSDTARPAPEQYFVSELLSPLVPFLATATRVLICTCAFAN